MTTIDLFLDELKSEYDREFELKSSLENKANYILIAAGVTLSLLFSFGSMMVGTLTSNYEYLNLVIVSLMIGVVTNGISVLFSVLGFSIKHYGYPFPYHVFFKDDPSNNKLVFNDEVIEQYRDGLGEILVLNQYKYSRNLLLKIILNVTKKMQSKITIKRQE